MFTYLLFNFFVILGPLLLSFESKIKYFEKWRLVLLANLIVALPFLLWDEIFTQNKIWGFSKEYLTGLKIFSLPLEEILFFFSVPFACIFIFEFSKLVFKNTHKSDQFFHKASILFAIVSLLSAVYFKNRIYSFVNFIVLSSTLAFIYWQKPKFTSQYALAFLISLFPFLIGNGILTSGFDQISQNPIVWYDNSENLGFRIFTIPLDDFFYWFSLFFWNVFVYEKIKKKTNLLDKKNR